MGTLPLRDNFDMCAPVYQYVARLNRLRAAYLAPVVGCDATEPSQARRGSPPVGTSAFSGHWSDHSAGTVRR
jgi:hypothetical protein